MFLVHGCFCTFTLPSSVRHSVLDQVELYMFHSVHVLGICSCCACALQLHEAAVFGHRIYKYETRCSEKFGIYSPATSQFWEETIMSS